jgi:hypothetical protein
MRVSLLLFGYQEREREDELKRRETNRINLADATQKVQELQQELELERQKRKETERQLQLELEHLKADSGREAGTTSADGHDQVLRTSSS